jgi:phosphate transport system substrate-binding protein
MNLTYVSIKVVGYQLDWCMNILSWLILSISAFFTCQAWSGIEIEGAGSSLSGKLMSSLGQEYQLKHDTLISYKPLGSGEGIRLLTSRVNDFALTDVAMTRYETELLGLVQFPLFYSAITPIVNLPGIESGQLVLDGQTLASMFLGDIKRWNDASIARLNPSLNLPDSPITVVTRADSSGTSYIFTGYLSNHSKKWRDTLGKGSKLLWTTGKSVEGTTKVIQSVKDTVGAIGYVELGAALRAQLATVNLKVSDTVQAPNIQNIEQASQHFTWRQGSLYSFAPTEQSIPMWPMVGVTYGLIPKTNSQELEGRETISFFNWIVSNKNAIFEDSMMVQLQNPVLVDQIKKKLSDLNRSKK